jgi:hypothetical protein
MKRLFLPSSTVVVFAILLVGVRIVFAQGNEQIVRDQYEGNLGRDRIGITIIHRGDNIKGGHYFYKKYLKDIPLTGAVEGSNVTLNESGGTFQLHFVGNGSEHGEPLTFENSMGVTGSWTSRDGRRSYPVSLLRLFENAYEGRQYADVTDDSDPAFEKRVQACFHAILDGDKSTVVRLTSYPLRVNFTDGQSRKLKDREQVFASWGTIFTPILLVHLRKALPHDMFVHEGMVMLANGDAWFDARGLAVVNVPASNAIPNKTVIRRGPH